MTALLRTGAIAGFLMVVFTRTVTTAAADGPAALPSGLTVGITPERAATSVGVPASVEIAVTNAGSDPSPPMAVHIDVTDPTSKGSVDPEDWTPELTRRLGTLSPGESVRVRWSLVPIRGGDYVVYAVLLSESAGRTPTALAVSNGTPVHVDEKRSFNPQGVTPLAAGIPLAIAALLVWRRGGLWRRRSHA